MCAPLEGRQKSKKVNKGLGETLILICNLLGVGIH